MERKASNGAIIINGASSDPITKKWLFDLLNMHMGMAEGIAVEDVRAQINNFDVVSSVDIGKVVRNPGGLWGWLLGEMRF